MFFKITNEEELHNGMQYRDGWNTDVVPFSPYGECEPGGIYFADEKHICEYLNYGPYIREVKLEDDEPVHHEGDKSKAHKVWLGERRDLRKISTWKWMVENGVDVRVNNDLALRRAAANGYLEVVRYLVEEHGVDVHARGDSAVQWAAHNSHLEVIKYLVEECGADIHADDDLAVRWAAESSHLEVVKYLVEECGANVHADDDYAFRWARVNGHTEVAKYLKGRE